jgi:hypothetical protein
MRLLIKFGSKHHRLPPASGIQLHVGAKENSKPVSFHQDVSVWPIFDYISYLNYRQRNTQPHNMSLQMLLWERSKRQVGTTLPCALTNYSFAKTFTLLPTCLEQQRAEWQAMYTWNQTSTAKKWERVMAIRTTSMSSKRCISIKPILCFLYTSTYMVIYHHVCTVVHRRLLMEARCKDIPTFGTCLTVPNIWSFLALLHIEDLSRI